jgi:polar amino acid transport system substrate-binding protein
MKYLFKKICVSSLLFLLIETPSLANTQTIYLNSLEWPPYIGKNLPNQGYVAQFVKSAFAIEGIKLEIKFLPWMRAYKNAKSGISDGLFPEYYSTENEKDFFYSKPFPGGPIGFYKRKDNPIKFSKLVELQSKRIGVVRGYINTKMFDLATYLDKHEATTDHINLKKLYFKRLDLIVIDKNVADHLIEKNNPDFRSSLEFMYPILEEKPLYIVFSKKSKNVKLNLFHFNKGALKLLKN